MRNFFRQGLLIAAVVWGMAVAAPSQATSVLNLTGLGSSGMINNARFQQFSTQPTGTGLIDSFVRIQNTGTERGYNTDGTVQFDTKVGTWTHSIQVGAAPLVTIGGVSYREFLLDINQINCPPGNYISLDALEVYTATTGNLASYPNLGTKVYTMDTASVDSSVKLDYNLNAGSGQGDMLFYLPSSLVSNSTAYLYLYSQFGLLNPANDGYEEWATRQSASALIPEPMTIVMCILGLGMLVIIRKYKTMEHTA